MHEPPRNNASHDERHDDPNLSVERLISRIVDAEATVEQREQFARLAENDSQLWRQLAIRHQMHTMLSARVERELTTAERVDLPVPPTVSPLGRSAMRWSIAISGWAALVAIVIVWSIAVTANRKPGELRPALPARSESGGASSLTPDEHLIEYLKAPFVVDELPPTLLEVEQQSDGSKLLHILRRIEEFVVLEPEAEVPVDEHGALIKPPSEMRDSTSTPPQRPQRPEGT